MKFYLFILFVSISLVSCDFSNKKSKIQKNDTIPTLPKSNLDRIYYSNYEEHVVNERGENSILVALLKNISDSLYYIYLEGKSEINEEAFTSIYKENSTQLFLDKDSLTSVWDLNKRNTEEYLDVVSIDTIYLIGNENIDTLFLKKYLALDESIQSSFIASYTSPKKYSNSNLIISKLKISSKVPSKKLIHLNQKGVQEVIKRPLNIEEDIYFSTSFSKNMDTFHIISQVNSNNLNRILFYKNNTLTDSVISEFAIANMIPVPLASEDFEVYMCSIEIPDTDAYWDSLIKLNTKTGKIYFLEGNRIKQ